MVVIVVFQRDVVESEALVSHIVYKPPRVAVTRASGIHVILAPEVVIFEIVIAVGSGPTGAMLLAMPDSGIFVPL